MLEIRDLGEYSEVFCTKTKIVFYRGVLSDCKKYIRNKRAKLAMKMKEQALKDLGLKKVRGALGGIYWE